MSDMDSMVSSSGEDSSASNSGDSYNDNLSNTHETWLLHKTISKDSDDSDKQTSSSESELENRTSQSLKRLSFQKRNSPYDKDYSDSDFYHNNQDTLKTSNLSDSSSDDADSDYQYSNSWKNKSHFRRKDFSKNTKRQHQHKNLQGSFQSSLDHPSLDLHLDTASSRRAGKRARGGRSSSTSESGSISFSSKSDEDNFRPTRVSRRATTSKISYKENDSTQETDSDEVLEAKDGVVEEEDLTEKIEKIMDRRHGRLRATGITTTTYNVKLRGDPNSNFDSAVEPTETHYLIKWIGRSHLHNTWESETSLKEANAGGMKRLENYKRKQSDIDVMIRKCSREEQDYYLCQQAMNKNVLENYKTVERVFGRSSLRNLEGRYEYNVKWVGLSYAESSWEDEALLSDFQNHIDEYLMREENPCVPIRDCRALRYRPPFVEMIRQPDWLSGKLQLRDYQLEGVNWLSRSWCKGNSVILADEMGLGKTIQTISFLSYLYHTHEMYGLFLVIVPLSTMTSWQNEFQTWAHFMNVIVYMGNQDSRAIIREVEWKSSIGHYKFNAVLTSYEILLKDKAFLGSHSWAVIAVDEAHRLKNEDSLLYKSLIEFKSNHRILITGTPMQNSLKELWALLHFIMPENFDSWPRFEEKHARNRAAGYASLHSALHPYLLRRVKKDVEKSLPAKVEKILRIRMTTIQRRYYKWILTRNHAALHKGSRGRGTISSFCNIIMELKKCCNHGHLVKDPEPLKIPTTEAILKDLLACSGKMVLLDKLLVRLKMNGHRVLIFSQMVQMLDIIQTYLQLKRLQFQRLDGSVDSAARRRALDHFNAEGSEDFCFLLSTRAGGLGINLATADTVIIFDSDWNPMNDLQAQARAHRIGQKKQVHIYRLVSLGSVEESIVERAKRKMVLDHLVIQRMDTSGKTVLLKTSTNSASNNPFNKEELNAILQFGAGDLFADTENDEKDPECDIDEILSRAETRQEQTGSSAFDELLSGFKVETFNLSEDEDQEIKDWDEIIPHHERSKWEEEERLKREKEMNLPPRQRKHLKFHGDSDDDDDDVSATPPNDESDQDDDDVTLTMLKGNKLGRGGTREADDVVEGFSTAEVRRFVRSFRKFADPLNRLTAIARDAELNEQSQSDLQQLAQTLYTRLTAAGDNMKTSRHQVEENKRGRGPSFRLGGVSVSVKTTLACIESLKPLDYFIPKDVEDRKSFRLDVPVRPVSSWSCKWTIDDDSKLLVGIYEYGMGSWDQIQSDSNLNLGKKIMKANNEKPQIRQLRSRSDYLIKTLAKAQLAEKSKPKGRTRTRKSCNGRKPHLPESSIRTSLRKRKTISKPQVPVEEEEEKDFATVTSTSDVNERISITINTANMTTTTSTVDCNEHLSTTISKKSVKSKRKREKEEDKDEQPIKSKKRKKHKSEHKPDATTASQPPTTISDNLIGSDVESLEEGLDEESFNYCKEHLRPVKKAFRQFDKLKSCKDEKTHLEKMNKCILRIGDRILECLKSIKDHNDIRKTRTKFWTFVSRFTELNASKLLQLYKSAVNQRSTSIESHKCSEPEDASKVETSKSPQKHKKSHKDKRVRTESNNIDSSNSKKDRSSSHQHPDDRKYSNNFSDSNRSEKSRTEISVKDSQVTATVARQLTSPSNNHRFSLGASGDFQPPQAIRANLSSKASPTKPSFDPRLHNKPHPTEDHWTRNRPAGPRNEWSPVPQPGESYRRRSPDPRRYRDVTNDFRPPSGYGARRDFHRSPPPCRDYYIPPSSGDRRVSGYYSPPRGHYSGSAYHPQYPGYQRRWRPPPEVYPPARPFPPQPYPESSAANYAMNPDTDPLRRVEKT